MCEMRVLPKDEDWRVFMLVVYLAAGLVSFNRK